MLSRQRQTAILAELRRAGAVRVSDLTEQFDVSDMTVRRDLDRLAVAGVIEKVHGGAVLINTVAAEPGFAANRSVAWAAKRAIAQAALELVEPGTVIGLSAGTTTWAMADKLAQLAPLTVVTNSTSIADTIASAVLGTPAPDVLLTGGRRTPSAALVGPLADATLSTLTVDIAFLGVHGLSERAGLSTPNLEEASTNRMLRSRALRTVVLADASKWGRVGLATFGDLNEIDILITDDSIDSAACDLLSDLGVDVRVVDAATEHAS